MFKSLLFYVSFYDNNMLKYLMVKAKIKNREINLSIDDVNETIKI